MKNILSIFVAVGLLAAGIGFAQAGTLTVSPVQGLLPADFERNWNNGFSVASLINEQEPQALRDVDRPFLQRIAESERVGSESGGTPVHKLVQSFEPQGYMDYDRPASWRIDVNTGTAF